MKSFSKERMLIKLLQKIFVIAFFFLAAFAQITIGAGIKDFIIRQDGKDVPLVFEAREGTENPAPNDSFLDGKDLVALCFHHVDTGGILSVESDQLKVLIMELSGKGYKFVDADDLLRYANGLATAPDKMAMITFDDGYMDNYVKAAPILKEFGVKGTFFVSTGKLGRDGYLTVGQVKALSDMGFAIGSHTVTHPNLSDVDISVVASEFEKSKNDLEEIIRKPVLTMAYPGGKVNDGVVSVADKYFTLAFLATGNEEKDERLKIRRWGVFSYNWDLESIKMNKQGE